MYLFDLEDYATFFTGTKFSYHFNPDGTYNGKNSWLSDDLSVKIIWDTTLNAWKLSGDTLGTIQVVNTNPAYPPINNNWTVLGKAYTVAANSGLCVPSTALSMVGNVTNPGCICDGSLSVTASGGVPPYQYSYNNGVTYENFPIKSNLCGGNFSVIVKDSEGTTFTKTFVMSQKTTSTEYYINLETISEVTTGVNTVETTYEIQVLPPLPAGVELTFDLVLASRFVRTPYINSASSTFTPQVIKNSQTITGSDNPLDSTLPNQSAGCQGLTLYITDYSTTYSGLKITKNDVYSVKTIKQFQLTCNNTPPVQNAINGFGDELGPLTYGQTASSIYSRCCNGYFVYLSSYITNGTIKGCNCCTVMGLKSLYE
jgi:hypothetical protein